MINELIEKEIAKIKDAIGVEQVGGEFMFRISFDENHLREFLQSFSQKLLAAVKEVIEEELKECPKCGTEHLKVIKFKLEKLK